MRGIIIRSVRISAEKTEICKTFEYILSLRKEYSIAVSINQIIKLKKKILNISAIFHSYININ
jgi:hypothetical protein